MFGYVYDGQMNMCCMYALRSLRLTLAGALMLPVWYPICREPSTAARMEVTSVAVRWFCNGVSKCMFNLGSYLDVLNLK